MAEVHVYGIRHHGPGSARSLVEALTALAPEAVLVEGPPEAADVVPLAAHEQMVPPVALLVHAVDDPGQASFYPFAVFSPEYRAIRYALEAGVPVRFIDLPVAQRFGLEATRSQQPQGPEHPAEAVEPAVDPDDGDHQSSPRALATAIRQDPIGQLGLAAGYDDSERWWEHMVEERRGSGAEDLFASILEAMRALREEVERLESVGPDPSAGARTTGDPLALEAFREAAMRQALRAAIAEGHGPIAVVCGAWHAPALARIGPARTDQTLLKGLPRVKVRATWVPWTTGRLTFASGYGAGVKSPGWYHHLWTAEDRVTVRWMARVARTLRADGVDVSPSHVIDAVRLAETLAAFRERPLPGLDEMNEATRSVLCHGDALPLALLTRRLIVGERLGRVPDETPMVPLAADLQRLQKHRELSAAVRGAA